MAERRGLKPNELHALPDGDLQAQLDTLRKELWNHRLKLREGSLQQNHQVASMRRQIARVLTVLGARRKAQQPAGAKG